MADLKFEKEITALLLIDPYNDFLSEGGKLWDRIKNVAEANDCIPHMLQLLKTARMAGVRVVYAMHHRYCPGDDEAWKYVAPVQEAAWSRRTLNPERGAANSVPNSSRRRATSSPRSTGVPVASRTPISTYKSRDTASRSSSSPALSHTRASN